MSTFEHIIRQARRRQFTALAVRRAGWGVCIAFVAALIVLVIDRIANLQLSPFVFAALVVAGFIAGWVQAMLLRPDRLAVAVQLDRNLRLKDRLGTAQAVHAARQAPAHHDQDFALLVQRDAQRLADSIDVRSVTPIRITGIWGTALSLALVLTVGFFYLPSPDWTSAAPGHTRSAEQTALQQQQAHEQAREMTHVISQAVADVPKDGLDQEAQKDLAALDRLARQMSSEHASPEQVDAARDESAARMDELAQRMVEQTQRDKAAGDELAKRFSGIDQTGAPKPPLSAKEFSEAIKRGDFGTAAEKLDELLKGASIPEDDRRAAAEHMRDLAKRIDETNQKPGAAPNTEELREHLSQALRDQGLDEKTIDELMDNPPQSPDEIADELHKDNVDEDVARDLARDIDRLRKENDVDDQVKQDSRDVSEALDRAADEVENPPPPPPELPPATSEPDQPQPPEAATSQPKQSAQRDRPKQDQNSKQQDRDQSGDKSNSSQDRDRPRNSGADQQQQSGASTKPDGQSSQSRDRQGTSQREQTQTSRDREEADQREGANQNRDRQGTAESQPSNQQNSQSTSKPDRAAGERQQQQQQQGKPSGDRDAQQHTGQRQPNTQSGDQQSAKSAERSGQPQSAQQRDGTNQNSDRQASQHREESNQNRDRPRNSGAADQPQSGNPDSQNQQQQQQQQQQQGQSAQRPDDQANQQSPSDVLRRLAERSGSAEDRQQSAEKLRELAKQFMKNTTPEQRKQWAEQWLKENGKQQQDQKDTRQAQRNPANEPLTEEQQKLAKELEDIAREMAKDMTPEERREWMERAEKLRQQQQLAGRQPDPSMMADGESDSKDDPTQAPPSGSSSRGSRTGQGRPNQADDSPQRLAQEDGRDAVDLRGQETADRIIAQWLSDQESPAPQGAQRGEAPESIRRAQDVAQRAVNDSAVQKRYHNTIKRYFGRLNETIKKAAGGNASLPPAPSPEPPATPPAPTPDPGRSP